MKQNKLIFGLLGLMIALTAQAAQNPTSSSLGILGLATFKKDFTHSFNPGMQALLSTPHNPVARTTLLAICAPLPHQATATTSEFPEPAAAAPQQTNSPFQEQDEEHPELRALMEQSASEKWVPDTLTELVGLLSKTHTIFTETLKGRAPSKSACDALRESWFNLSCLSDQSHTFDNFSKKIKENYRRCHLSGIPSLHICLGLEKSDDITDRSISFLNQIVAAEKAFKAKKDPESFDFLHENFTGMYCRLEQEFGMPPFEGVTKEQFLLSFTSPETATESCEKMFALLRQSAYLAREQHDLELYKAYKRGKEAFDATKVDYLNSFATLQLNPERIATIMNSLMMVGAQGAEPSDITQGITSTELPKTLTPHTVTKLLRSASSKLSSVFSGTLSLLFSEKVDERDKEEELLS